MTPLPLNSIVIRNEAFQGVGGYRLVWIRRAKLFQRNSAVQQSPIPLVLDWKGCQGSQATVQHLDPVTNTNYPAP
jgi:hypothetical protein